MEDPVRIFVDARIIGDNQEAALFKEKILNEKRCILIVTHDARINEYADRILHMEDGHLTAEDKGTE